MTKAEIIKKARVYCEESGLSCAKLEKEEIYHINDSFIFAHPVCALGNGLRNDIESQPKPTLIFSLSENSFEQTEYTKKYLT